MNAIDLSMADLFERNGHGQPTVAPPERQPKIFPSYNAARNKLRKDLGRETKPWEYLDVDGNVAGVILRWDTSDGKEIRPVSPARGGWVIAAMPEPRPLYCLPDLAEAERVYVTEGEKATDAARSLGLIATTSPNGSKSAAKADWSPLVGKEVVILPDNDDAGGKYAAEVARILSELDPPASVKVVTLDHLSDGGDIADWVDGWTKRGKSEDQLRRRVEELVDAAEPMLPPPPGDTGEAVPSGGKKSKPSETERLIGLASDEAEFWHTPDTDAFATFEVDGHKEHWPILSRGFRRWLSWQFYKKERTAPSAQSVADTLLLLEGRSVYAGEEHPAAIRAAEHEGDFYYDLCDEAWRAVRVTPSGLEVVDSPPVRFRRARAMLPLPEPREGGDVADLRRYLNVTNDAWPLVIAGLLAAMRPTGPYPVLCLHGEQGSAKSTAARVLRELIDPNSAPLRSEPREPRDLMIAANNGWVIALDNMSHLKPWLSDALCRLSTGGGFSTRKLYRDDEEMIFEAMRPLILTGIEEVATRGDLLDRSLLVSLPTIAEDDRRPEKEFWADFNRRRPRLFGAMLTAVSEAMAALPDVSLDRLPRMADFACWATAGEEALGLPAGGFLEAYAGNRESSNEVVLESSPVSRYVMELVSELRRGEAWEGRASDLLNELEELASEGDKRLRSWPKSPQGMGGALKRLAPNLRAAGIEVEFGFAGSGSTKRRNILLRASGDDSPRKGVRKSSSLSSRSSRPHKSPTPARDVRDVSQGERDDERTTRDDRRKRSKPHRNRRTGRPGRPGR